MVHKMEPKWLRIPILLNGSKSYIFPVFAQQGYFVVAINPTGSTTFGQSNIFRERLLLTDLLTCDRFH